GVLDFLRQVVEERLERQLACRYEDLLVQSRKIQPNQALKRVHAAPCGLRVGRGRLKLLREVGELIRQLAVVGSGRTEQGEGCRRIADHGVDLASDAAEIRIELGGRAHEQGFAVGQGEEEEQQRFVQVLVGEQRHDPAHDVGEVFLLREKLNLDLGRKRRVEDHGEGLEDLRDVQVGLRQAHQ